MVTIIIPFKDKISYLLKCLKSIFAKTVDTDFEIILINNQSQKKQTISTLNQLKNKKSLTLLDYDLPFNFAAINNFAANHSKNKFLLFLNNDTEIITTNWLNILLSHFTGTNTGAVGAKLLYKNNTIQHAGIFTKNNIIGHMYSKMLNIDDCNAPFNNVYEPDAVTAACMMTPRDIFQTLGGFDETNFSIAYNDVDYCLRLRSLGYKIIYDPNVELYHYESASRINDKWSVILHRRRYQQFRYERELIKKRWKI